MGSKILLNTQSMAGCFNKQFHVNRSRKESETVYLPLSADNEDSSRTLCCNTLLQPDPLLRITELENTVKFLKSQQQRMLSSLHKEISTLQEKNRDLLFQLVFLKKFPSTNSNLEEITINNEDIRNLLCDIEAGPGIRSISNGSVTDGERSSHVIACSSDCTSTGPRHSAVNDHSDIYQLKHIIEEQKREIEQLKERQELTKVKNKLQSYESRHTDIYIRDLESKNKEYEKLLRFLHKENKEQRMEIEHLRKNFNSLRISPIANTPAGLSIAQQVHPRSPIFPPLHSQTTFWCHNIPTVMNEYQLQTSSTVNCSDGAAAIPSIFTLPQLCNFGQVATAASATRYYSGGAAANYYGILHHPIGATTTKAKSHSSSSYKADNISAVKSARQHCSTTQTQTKARNV